MLAAPRASGVGNIPVAPYPPFVDLVNLVNFVKVPSTTAAASRASCVTHAHRRKPFHISRSEFYRTTLMQVRMRRLAGAAASTSSPPG